jgi:hypothetical protein
MLGRIQLTQSDGIHQLGCVRLPLIVVLTA